MPFGVTVDLITTICLTKRLWEMKDVVDMLEAWEAAYA